MTTQPLKQFAALLQKGVDKLDNKRKLLLYIICCALGCLACGYALYNSFNRPTALYRITPITPPILLYEPYSDSVINHNKKN